MCALCICKPTQLCLKGQLLPLPVSRDCRSHAGTRPASLSEPCTRGQVIKSSPKGENPQWLGKTCSNSKADARRWRRHQHCSQSIPKTPAPSESSKLWPKWRACADGCGMASTGLCQQRQPPGDTRSFSPSHTGSCKCTPAQTTAAWPAPAAAGSASSATCRATRPRRPHPLCLPAPRPLRPAPRQQRAARARARAAWLALPPACPPCRHLTPEPHSAPVRPYGVPLQRLRVS